MLSVSIVGGPIPYREALEARAAERGWVTASIDADSAGDTSAGSTVAVVYCDSDDAWRQLAAALADGHLGAVAVIERLDPALYRRALALGAGVVHHDTSTEIIAQVIESAGHGEALIPISVAQRLVTELPDDAAPGGVLDDLEASLLRGIVEGETIVSLAERFHFSERTIRRRLQGAYLKLGVEDRVGAIRVVERDRLLD